MINQGTVGGGQRHLADLVARLDRRRFDVTVACGRQGPLAEELRQKRIPVVTLPVRRNGDLRYLWGVYRLLRQGRFHILHVHGGVAGVWGRLAAFLAGTPLRVYTLHGIHYLHFSHRLLGGVYRFVERLLAYGTDRIICVSQADLRKGMRAKVIPNNRGRVVPNGIDPRRFDGVSPIPPKHLRKTLGLGEQVGPIIGTVARLHPQKGLSYLLQATRLLRMDFPKLQVLILGDGPLEGSLKAEAQRLGIASVVHFLGVRSDVVSILSCMEVFVLPSLWEGLPISLLEAQALGRPVVATAVDGTTEVVEDGRTGVLVPPKDPEALAGGVAFLLRNPEQAARLAKAGREKVRRKYDLAHMIQATEQLYLELYRQWRRQKAERGHPCA